MDTKQLAFELKILGLSVEQGELAKVNIALKELNDNQKKIDESFKKGKITLEQYVAQTAANTKATNENKTAQTELKKVVDSAPDSLNRMRAELIRLKNEYANTSAEVREKMAPAINKLNTEISKAEQATGVFSRNVGNYPKITGEASTGLRSLTSAVGGVTAEIGEATTGFLTAGSAAGIVTVAISFLAAAWKRTRDNIELYLKSADKVLAGSAAFERDSEKALADTRKRARGEEAEGIRVQMSARRELNLHMHEYTDEQNKALDEEIKSGEAMQKNGRSILDSLILEKDRTAWKVKYNALLTEEEKLNDEKLERETEWEGLEANLVKQRAIVSDMESTSAQKKQAAVDADVIANKLVASKTGFIDRELANVNAIAAMTNKQEVVEDKVNGLLKERNTVQKEYYADQVKINRLENTAGKGDEELKNLNEFHAIKQGLYDEWDKNEKKRLEDKWNFDLDLGKKNFAAQKKAAKDEMKVIDDKIEYEKNAEEEAQKVEIQGYKLNQEAKYRIAQSASNLINSIAGKNKGLQKAALIADKALAIAEIIIQTKKANAAIMFWGSLGGPIGIALAMAARIKNNISAALDIAAVIAATAIGLAGFAKGGKINRGVPINTSTKDDTLIAVNKTETVITQDHVRMLGGSGAMRRIKVPGYESGGYIGQMAPEIPSAGLDYDRFERMMRTIEVRLDINKLNTAQSELSVITEAQRI